MLLSAISLRQQSVVRYLVPLVKDIPNPRRLGAAIDLGDSSYFAKHFSHSTSAMNSSKFHLSQKYKGLEKNVWYF